MRKRKLYVGNISYEATTEELTGKFSEFGNVESVKIIKDRDTGRSKGFGFVEMSSNEEAEKCVENLNNQEFQGRGLRVTFAKDA